MGMSYILLTIGLADGGRDCGGLMNWGLSMGPPVETGPAPPRGAVGIRGDIAMEP